MDDQYCWRRARRKSRTRPARRSTTTPYVAPRPVRLWVVNAYADWLQLFPLSSFVTFTWSDDAAAARYVYTDRAAVKDIERFLDKELRYPGQYFGVIEDHMHRNVPHAHLLMENATDWQVAWQAWKRTRGIFCSRPAESGAFYYVAKYVLKDGRCGERVLESLRLAGRPHGVARAGAQKPKNA